MTFLSSEMADINFTFGIITSGEGDAMHRVGEIINSIDRQKMPKNQIVIVGGTGLYSEQALANINTDPNFSVEYIPFDETFKKAWITKKKNLITQHAKYENIVYMHDYLYFYDDWYKNFVDFGTDWDLCMNAIVNANDKRYRDWVTWDHPNIDPRTRQVIKHKVQWTQTEPWCPDGRVWKGGGTLMPYDYTGNHMYISGTYWVAKKHVMEAEPMNEDLCHSDAEDVEWSLRVRDKYKYVMNENSVVKLLNFKPLDATWFNLLNREKKW